MQQSDLFEPLLAAYRNVQINDEGISNQALYEALDLVGGERKPVGRARQPTTWNTGRSVGTSKRCASLDCSSAFLANEATGA